MHAYMAGSHSSRVVKEAQARPMELSVLTLQRSVRFVYNILKHPWRLRNMSAVAVAAVCATRGETGVGRPLRAAHSNICLEGFKSRPRSRSRSKARLWVTYTGNYGGESGDFNQARQAEDLDRLGCSCRFQPPAGGRSETLAANHRK